MSSVMLIVLRGEWMTLKEQIKVLCAYANLSQAELARRFGTSPQNFGRKLAQENFYIADLQRIAELTGAEFKESFTLKSGHIIE